VQNVAVQEEQLIGTILVRDSAAVKEIEAGKRAMSIAGYTRPRTNSSGIDRVVPSLLTFANFDDVQP
jgi:hypothetical protein